MCYIANVHKDAMREALVCAQEVTSKLTRAIDDNDKMAEQVVSTREKATLIDPPEGTVDKDARLY